MTFAPPVLARRSLALALLLGLILLVFEVLIAPLPGKFQEIDAAIDRSAQLLARYRLSASEKEAVTQALSAQRQNLSGLSGFIVAPNQPLASSTLQTHIRRVLESAGASVRVLSVPPAIRESSYDKLVARVEFSVTADRLIATIHAIEASTSPNLVIDSLEIRGQDLVGPTARAEENTSLSVRLDAVGYWVPK